MHENVCPYCQHDSLQPPQDIRYFQSEKPSSWQTRKCSACGKVAVFKDQHLEYPKRAAAPTTQHTRREPRRDLGPAYLRAQLPEGKAIDGYFADASDEGIGMKTLEPFFLPASAEVVLSTITEDDSHPVLAMRAQIRHSSGFRHGFRLARERSLKFLEPSWENLIPPEPT